MHPRHHEFHQTLTSVDYQRQLRSYQDYTNLVQEFLRVVVGDPIVVDGLPYQGGHEHPRSIVVSRDNRYVTTS